MVRRLGLEKEAAFSGAGDQAGQDRVAAVGLRGDRNRRSGVFLQEGSRSRLGHQTESEWRASLFTAARIHSCADARVRKYGRLSCKRVIAAQRSNHGIASREIVWRFDS